MSSSRRSRGVDVEGKDKGKDGYSDDSNGTVLRRKRTNREAKLNGKSSEQSKSNSKSKSNSNSNSKGKLRSATKVESKRVKQSLVPQIDLGDIIVEPKIEYTKLFINNKFVDATLGDTIDVINPSSEEKICEVSAATKEDVDLAVAAAEKAFELGSEWRTMDASLRGELLYRVADLMERDRENLAALEVLDSGKTYGDAFNVDLTLAIKCFRYYAGWADKLHGNTIPLDGPFMCMTRREPIGVVGAITPWNFPILMITWKLAPALCCGNCVVLKPAEQTPVTALAIAALFREAGFPPGVLNVVPGFGASAGNAIAEHPKITKVAFTGSTKVGKTIMEAAGRSNCKNVTLELGGKSPCIVFEDADIEQALETAHHAIFFNQGQCCAAGSRTYVQDSIYDEFVRKATARARSRITGNPLQRGTEHGPQVNETQMNKILSLIEEGKKGGAKLACGGKRWGKKGYFVEPTVLYDVPQDNICAQEEIFGPVQVIIRFRTVEEVVTLANDSNYGLASAVLTHDLDIAMKMSQQLRAGSVWINCYDIFAAQAPFGGYKESGVGRELGEKGLEQYSETKTVVIRVSSKNS